MLFSVGRTNVRPIPEMVSLRILAREFISTSGFWFLSACGLPSQEQRHKQQPDPHANPLFKLMIYLYDGKRT